MPNLVADETMTKITAKYVMTKGVDSSGSAILVSTPLSSLSVAGYDKDKVFEIFVLMQHLTNYQNWQYVVTKNVELTLNDDDPE